MPSVTELELPYFDYADPSLRGERFHAAMHELRARNWLAAMPLGFATIDREAGEFFLRSRAFTFPGMKIAEIFGIDDGPLWEEIRRNILHINGADHSRLRGLVNPAFTPRAVERWRPAMRGFLSELFAPLASAGRCDAVEALAKPYPSMVITTVMGAPLEDHERLWDWSRWIQRQFGMSVLEEREQIERAVVEFYDYAGALLEARRQAPGEDLISTLIAAEQEGDRLSDVELLNLVLNVLVGGVDTTQSQLAHALRLFAEHPEQWAMLAADPALAPRAVEEVLRFEPITPFTARIAMEDVEFRGVTFPAGTVVLVCAFTGNRDDAAYEAPDAFDIRADRAGAKPLTFGAGVHYCLGANLARAELAEALAFLAPRMPGLELDGEPVYGSIDGIYGLDALPVRWG
ncbi:MAG: cytochrome P450 [Actinomycetota bacterium]|nr:cytochrome P450 [Actinomycetota bacterium]